MEKAGMSIHGKVAGGDTMPGQSTRSPYIIGILFVIYTFNYLDRQIVNILAEPIKQDLGLADWQLGMIGGLAFALFYTTLGIPLARWADSPKRDRIALISVSLALWSGMTAICGAATNFVQLMLARIGVGVGEAGCSPAAHSLISDVVPKERRATALGIYSLGIPIGKLSGMVMGGWIAHEYGWRIAFLVVGAPGVILALVAWFTIKDPRRFGLGSSGQEPGTIGESWRVLKGSPVFWLATFGCAFTSLVSLGCAAFYGSFMIRIHGFDVQEAGLWLGLSLGLGGAAGSWLGGVICDRAGRHDPRHHMVLPGMASLGGGALIAMAMLVSSPATALWLLFGSAILTSFWYGPIFSAVQGIAPPTSRATAAAVHLFVVGALGLGLGPLLIGSFSDALNAGAITGRALGSAEGLRWALAIAPLFTILAFILFMIAARKVSRPQNEGSAI